jgi:hypothetical protein
MAFPIDLLWRSAKLLKDRFRERKRDFSFPGKHGIRARSFQFRKVPEIGCSRLRQARTIVSWTASSASKAEPNIR